MILAGVALLPLLAGGTSAASPLRGALPAPPIGTVHAAKVPGVGTVLVNAAGQTLYIFAPDHRSRVTCTGRCAHSWPPLELRHGKPIAGPGINAKLLRTIKGPGHATYVTYNNWPLYTLVGDDGPGTAAGLNMYAFGGYWRVLSASGQVVKSTRASTGASSSSSSRRSSTPAGGAAR
jgi:predicted lipoprotein with Yx(FWY)xxD motif